MAEVAVLQSGLCEWCVAKGCSLGCCCLWFLPGRARQGRRTCEAATPMVMSSLPWSLAEVGVADAGDLQECLLTWEERVCQSSGCPMGVHLDWPPDLERQKMCGT